MRILRLLFVLLLFALSGPAVAEEDELLLGCWVEKSSSGETEIRWDRDGESWRGALRQFRLIKGGAQLATTDFRLDRPGGSWRMCAVAGTWESNCAPAFFGEGVSANGDFWTVSVTQKRLQIEYVQNSAAPRKLINGKRRTCR